MISSISLECVAVSRDISKVGIGKEGGRSGGHQSSCVSVTKLLPGAAEKRAAAETVAYLRRLIATEFRVGVVAQSEIIHVTCGNDHSSSVSLVSRRRRPIGVRSHS